jgi:hypothetical protein
VFHYRISFASGENNGEAVVRPIETTSQNTSLLMSSCNPTSHMEDSDHMDQWRLVTAALVFHYRISFASGENNGEAVERDMKDQLTHSSYALLKQRVRTRAS